MDLPASASDQANNDAKRKTQVVRVPLSGGSLVDPFIKDETAVIHRAEDVSILIKTISSQVYTQYKDKFRAGEFGNDWFVLLSETGVGNPDKPVLKVHEIQPIIEMGQNLTGLWADNVLCLEDFGADAHSVSKIRISFHALCQNIGDSDAGTLKNSLGSLLKVAGAIFPFLVPWVSVANVVVEGAQRIVDKLNRIQEEVETTTFTFFPFGESANGDAPLQTGSFILFFEEVDTSSLSLGDDGIVRSSDQDSEIPPYIVVNVEKQLVLAPDQLKTSMATEVLSKFGANEHSVSQMQQPSSLSLIDALTEFGKSYQLAQYAGRYFELKKKANLSSAEQARFTQLKDALRQEFPEWDLENT